MPDAIRIEIESNAAQVVRKLEAFPDRMGAAIAGAMDYENELTVGRIQATKLSRRGPKTLGVVTNRLRSSIRPTKARATGASVVSAIGSNVVYAGVHEFGFSGVVGVRGFTRRQRTNDILESGERRGFAAVAQRERLLARGIARVAPHRRRLNIPARAYIRTTIDERAGAYSLAVSRAIVDAWQGGAS